MTEEQFMLIFMGIMLLVCVIYAVLPEGVKKRFHQLLERLVDKIDIFFEDLDKKREKRAIARAIKTTHQTIRNMFIIARIFYYLLIITEIGLTFCMFSLAYSSSTELGRALAAILFFLEVIGYIGLFAYRFHKDIRYHRSGFNVTVLKHVDILCRLNFIVSFIFLTGSKSTPSLLQTIFYMSTYYFALFCLSRFNYFLMFSIEKQIGFILTKIIYSGLVKGISVNQYTFNTVNNLLKLDEHDKELIKAYSDGFDIERLTVKKVTEEVSFNDHYISYSLPNDKTVYAEKRKQETQSYSFCIDVAGIPNTWQSQTIFVTKTESEDVSFSELPFFDRLAAKLF